MLSGPQKPAVVAEDRTTVSVVRALTPCPVPAETSLVLTVVERPSETTVPPPA